MIQIETDSFSLSAHYVKAVPYHVFFPLIFKYLFCSKSESSSASKSSTKLNGSAGHKAVPSQNTNALSSNYEDDFDDFDPRGTSMTSKSFEHTIET